MAVISHSVGHRLYPAAGDDEDDAAQHNTVNNTATILRGAPERLPCGWLCVSARPSSQTCFFPVEDDRILRIVSPAAIWTSHDRYQGVTWFWERYIPQCHRVRSLLANASGLVRPF
jgi:hypothetical protein